MWRCSNLDDIGVDVRCFHEGAKVVGMFRENFVAVLRKERDGGGERLSAYPPAGQK